MSPPVAILPASVVPPPGTVPPAVVGPIPGPVPIPNVGISVIELVNIRCSIAGVRVPVEAVQIRVSIESIAAEIPVSKPGAAFA
jgi:hypothetical protein